MKNILSFTDLNMPFMDHNHETAFYETWLDIGRADVDSVVTMYLLTATAPTRAALWDIMDSSTCDIKDDCWGAAWQTVDSRRVIALVCNLTLESEEYHGLDPVHLFSSNKQLCHVMQAAIAYWYCQKFGTD